MIRTLEAKRFGCLEDVEADLEPIHAFIGPNDSGKSTLLHALNLAVNSVTRADWDPQRQFSVKLLTSTDEPFSVSIGFGKHTSYVLERKRSQHTLTESFSFGGQNPHVGTISINDQSIRASGEDVLPAVRSHPRFAETMGALEGARLLRLDPDALRQPSPLIPENDLVNFFDERGRGLPGVYDAILNRGDDSFQIIAEEVRNLFPTVRHPRLRTISSSQKVLEVELHDGQRVGSDAMSEGMLYYLAFAALPYLAPVSLLLVEEPENGLHPARIADVVRVMRRLSESGCQVVMATHSPLVINEMEPAEVSVVTRSRKQGTMITRIHDTTRFEERSRVYALGELWLSYANGEDEAPLLGREEDVT